MPTRGVASPWIAHVTIPPPAPHSAYVLGALSSIASMLLILLETWGYVRRPVSVLVAHLGRERDCPNPRTRGPMKSIPAPGVTML